MANGGKTALARPPRISVVIPVLNGEPTIDAALDSALAQTFSDIEVIVVDDGSTDRTLALLAQRTDDRLIVIRHERNRGAAAARNSGIARARGDWIAFLDSDDTWTSNKLARQIEMLEKSGSGAVACATGYHLRKNGRNLTICPKLSAKQYRREILFGCTISPGSTLLVSREVFNQIGAFDESFGRLEDWDWLLRFVKRHDIVFVPQPLAEIHVTPRPQGCDNGKIEAALDLIREKHSLQLPLLPRMTLHSSLLIEKAAMLHRLGKPWAAAAHVVAALSIYPLRNAAFFRMIWRSVRQTLRL